MDEIFKKLRLKDEKKVYVLNALDSFEENIKSIVDNFIINREIKEASKINFALAFVTGKEEVDELAKQIIPKMEGDAKIWMCYPKKTSKKYKTEINRDHPWLDCFY